METEISKSVALFLRESYQLELDPKSISFQKTKHEFEGELTLVVFPFLRFSKKNPVQTATEIGTFLKENCPIVADFNVVKGFLNLSLKQDTWLSTLKGVSTSKKIEGNNKTLMVEYSSPNTNKPLHLGHIRNNFLGYSVAEILKASGNKVLKTQIINDRGIHICKSMLAWKKYANGATPESTGIKGDHFVGDYYVLFDKYYKAEMEALMKEGMSQEVAMQEAPSFKEAGAMLRDWEEGEEEVVELWKTMNQWVYDGFKSTYKAMGVDFDELYYESDTYKLGKNIVEEGIKKCVFYRREDGSVWCDLTKDGLDEKLVLRKDGTAVYMTQDIGTAIERYRNHKIDGIVYTVGNEQEYHFKVLFLILKKLGYDFWEGLYHLSYGMVELPSGRMKTREGTVVDADDIMEEMLSTASAATAEKGKMEGFSTAEIKEINRRIGMAALKYFILKVDPKKGMVFNPEESIDFNGNTGPFIMFNYVRTQSVLAKHGKAIDLTQLDQVSFSEKEIEIIGKLADYPKMVQQAAKSYSPSIIANYCYDLAKDYSQFYAAHQILKEENEDLKAMRLLLSQKLGSVLKNSMELLGIETVERM